MRSLDVGAQAFVAPSSDIDLPDVDITPRPVVVPEPISIEKESEKIDEEVVMVERASLGELKDTSREITQEPIVSTEQGLRSIEAERVPCEASVEQGEEAAEIVKVADHKPVTKEKIFTPQVTERDCQTSPMHENLKDNIQIIKKVSGEEETIEISTKPGYAGEAQMVSPSSEADDIVVEMTYDDDKSNEPHITSVSELSITHTTPHSFETIVSDPAETTTKVIVDEDGTKRIIVRQLRKTITTRHQQQMATVQRLTTITSDSCDVEPETSNQMAFSQVVLQGQQMSTSDTADGQTVTSTTQSYSGRVTGGVPGDVHVAEFSTGPQETVTYHTGDVLPSTVLIRGQELLQGGDIITSPSGITPDQALMESLSEQFQVPKDIDTEDSRTTTSSVRAVVEQVTRRVVRRSRKIIRKVVIIDGKEHVTEEVIELPEEVEVSEAGVPLVRIEMSQTETGKHPEQGETEVKLSTSLGPDQITSTYTPESQHDQPDTTFKHQGDDHPEQDYKVLVEVEDKEPEFQKVKDVKLESETKHITSTITTVSSVDDGTDRKLRPELDTGEDPKDSRQEREPSIEIWHQLQHIPGDTYKKVSVVGIDTSKAILPEEGKAVDIPCEPTVEAVTVESKTTVYDKPAEPEDDITGDKAIVLEAIPYEQYKPVRVIELVTSAPHTTQHVTHVTKKNIEGLPSDAETGIPKLDTSGDPSSEIQQIPWTDYKEVRVVEIQPPSSSITLLKDTVVEGAMPSDVIPQDSNLELQQVPGSEYKMVRVVEVISPVTTVMMDTKTVAAEGVPEEIQDQGELAIETTPEDKTSLREVFQIEHSPEVEIEGVSITTSSIPAALEKDIDVIEIDAMRKGDIPREVLTDTYSAPVESYRLVRVVEINKSLPLETVEMHQGILDSKTQDMKEDATSKGQVSGQFSTQTEFPEEKSILSSEITQTEVIAPENTGVHDQFSQTITIDPMQRIKIDITTSAKVKPLIPGDEKQTADIHPQLSAAVEMQKEDTHENIRPSDDGVEFHIIKRDVSIEFPSSVTITEIKTVEESAVEKPIEKEKDSESPVTSSVSSAGTKKKGHRKGKHKHKGKITTEPDTDVISEIHVAEKEIAHSSEKEPIITGQEKQEPTVICDVRLTEDVDLPSNLPKVQEEVKIEAVIPDDDDEVEESIEGTEKSHDTGYDAEDKTLNEQNLPEDDAKRKRKKKRRKKLRDTSETPEVYPLSPKYDSSKSTDFGSSIPYTSETPAAVQQSPSESIEIECTPSQGSGTQIVSPHERMITDQPLSLDDTTVSENLDSQEVPFEPQETIHPVKDAKKKKGQRSKKSKDSSASVSQGSIMSDVGGTVQTSKSVPEVPEKSESVPSSEPASPEDYYDKPVEPISISEPKEELKSLSIVHESEVSNMPKEVGASDSLVEETFKRKGKQRKQPEESSQLSSLDEPMEITIQTVVSFINPEDSESVTTDEVEQRPLTEELVDKPSSVEATVSSKEPLAESRPKHTQSKKGTKRKAKHAPQSLPHGIKDGKEHSPGADDTTTIVQTIEFEVPSGVTESYEFRQVEVIDKSKPEPSKETKSRVESFSPLMEPRPDNTTVTPLDRQVSFREIPVAKDEKDERSMQTERTVKALPQHEDIPIGQIPSSHPVTVTQSEGNVEFTLSVTDDLDFPQEIAQALPDELLVPSQMKRVETTYSPQERFEAASVPDKVSQSPVESVMVEYKTAPYIPGEEYPEAVAIPVEIPRHKGKKRVEKTHFPHERVEAASVPDKASQSPVESVTVEYKTTHYTPGEEYPEAAAIPVEIPRHKGKKRVEKTYSPQERVEAASVPDKASQSPVESVTVEYKTTHYTPGEEYPEAAAIPVEIPRHKGKKRVEKTHFPHERVEAASVPDKASQLPVESVTVEYKTTHYTPGEEYPEAAAIAVEIPRHKGKKRVEKTYSPQERVEAASVPDKVSQLPVESVTVEYKTTHYTPGEEYPEAAAIPVEIPRHKGKKRVEKTYSPHERVEAASVPDKASQSPVESVMVEYKTTHYTPGEEYPEAAAIPVEIPCHKGKKRVEETYSPHERVEAASVPDKASQSPVESVTVEYKTTHYTPGEEYPEAAAIPVEIPRHKGKKRVEKTHFPHERVEAASVPDKASQSPVESVTVEYKTTHYTPGEEYPEAAAIPVEIPRHKGKKRVEKTYSPQERVEAASVPDKVSQLPVESVTVEYKTTHYTPGEEYPEAAAIPVEIPRHKGKKRVEKTHSPHERVEAASVPDKVSQLPVESVTVEYKTTHYTPGEEYPEAAAIPVEIPRHKGKKRVEKTHSPHERVEAASVPDEAPQSPVESVTVEYKTTHYTPGEEHPEAASIPVEIPRHKGKKRVEKTYSPQERVEAASVPDEASQSPVESVTVEYKTTHYTPGEEYLEAASIPVEIPRHKGKKRVEKTYSPQERVEAASVPDKASQLPVESVTVEYRTTHYTPGEEYPEAAATPVEIPHLTGKSGGEIIRQSWNISSPQDTENITVTSHYHSSVPCESEMVQFPRDEAFVETIERHEIVEELPGFHRHSVTSYSGDHESLPGSPTRTKITITSHQPGDLPAILSQPTASTLEQRDLPSAIQFTELITSHHLEKEIPESDPRVTTPTDGRTYTVSTGITYSHTIPADEASNLPSPDSTDSRSTYEREVKEQDTADQAKEIDPASRKITKETLSSVSSSAPDRGDSAKGGKRGRSRKSRKDSPDTPSPSGIPSKSEQKHGKHKSDERKVKHPKPHEDFPEISTQKTVPTISEPLPSTSTTGTGQKEMSYLPGALLYSQVVKSHSREPSPVKELITGVADLGRPQEISSTSPEELLVSSQIKTIETTHFPGERFEAASVPGRVSQSPLESVAVEYKTTYYTPLERAALPRGEYEKEDSKPKEREESLPKYDGNFSEQPISQSQSKLHVATNALAERLNNLQNVCSPSQMSGLILYATRSQSIPDDSSEVQQHLGENMEDLGKALKERDAAVIESTYITTIEVISYWLEIIEHRIYSIRQVGDIKVQESELLGIDEEIEKVGKNLGLLEDNLGVISQICNEDAVLQIQNCLSSLKDQAKNVSDTAKEDEDTTKYGIQQWEEFQNCINSLSLLIEESRKHLEGLGRSDSPAHSKLQELENLDAVNQGHRHELKRLISIGSKLAMEFPGGEFPQECSRALDAVRSIEHGILKEKEKILQLLSLTDEYKQTLDEFAQIIEVADSLVEGAINVNGLNHLQEEMQKHRKFFANLSHCRQILESLEGNLDPETRNNHAELHRELHGRAAAALDKAAGRAQQMALAASRWTVLEQGAKEEEGWVRVAHQRMPDLANVKTSDYNQFISLYQALSSDIVIHHARVMQLMNIANKLQEIITCTGLDGTYNEFTDVIIKLQDNVSSNLHKLLVFKEAWAHFNMLSCKLENWVNEAEINLASITTPDLLPLNVREFWELKAQFEVYNYIHKEANRSFEQAMAILPVADKAKQSQIHEQLEDRWNALSVKIETVQTNLRNSITQDIPANEKLIILERELRELKLAMEDMNGIIKTEEDLNLYVERIQVLCSQVESLEEELGCLGFLPASESEHVGALLGSARRLGLQLREELEAGIRLREKLQTLQRGMAKVRKSHERAEGILQQCNEAQTLGSEVVEQALNNCQALQEELHLQWQDLVALRQLLHSLPHRLMFASVSPVRLERDITALQDTHQGLEQQCSHLLLSLRSRLTMWRNFENALELVQRHVDEADYMMELITVKGSLNYEHLCTATQRLEDLCGSLEQKEKNLLSDLRSAAAPLAKSCAPEARRRVEEAVQEAIAAWNETCESLGHLCERYQSAVRLWQQYREASEAVKEWAERQLDSASLLDTPHACPEDSLRLVEVCEKNLAEQRDRLGELRGLVAQIASDVGLEGGVVLQGEVEALGHRLEDVRESLATLAQVAESRTASAAPQGNATPFAADLQSTHNFLSSVQQSLSAVEESNMKDAENQLNTLRNHLLSLGKSEGHIQNLKEKAIEVNSSNPESSVSIVDILQLWQQVFRETFQQYHRLSASLVKSQDGAAALQLWQEYLLHVQSFLSESIPADYHGLTEQQHLCEVHQNLLTAQQSILLSKGEDKGDRGDVISKKAANSAQVMEQFNSLTNLHNETLARIMERHGKVKARITGWEKYRRDQDSLLRWLKEMEQEKQKLQLRYIHIRSLPNTINKIQVLLDQIPEGESQADNLHAQQTQLLEFCEEALATSIRIEHAAIVQRINNLQASLETWKDFLNRVSSLQHNYEEKSGRVQVVLREIHSKAISQKPLSHGEMQATLQSLHMLQGELRTLVSDLQELVGTQEQLKDCVSPTDMKGISQKSWLLWQQHGDLEHQLALLSHQIEEKLGMHKLFDSRYARFIVWVKDMEERLSGPSIAPGNESAEDLVAYLEGDEGEGEELGLKGKEVAWLMETGDKLLEMYEDDDYKKEVREKVKLVQDSWNLISQLRKNRILKLQELIVMLSTLESQQLELRTRLHQLEAKLMSPLTFTECSKAEVESMLKSHEELQLQVDDEEAKVNEVIGLCDRLLVESELTDARVDVDYIQSTRDNIMRRWKNILALSSNRKRKIQNVWTLLVDMLKLCSEHEEWLSSRQQIIEDITENGPAITKDDILRAINRVEGVLNDLESKNPALQIMEQSYSKLAKEAGFKLPDGALDAAKASDNERPKVEESVDRPAQLPPPLHRVRSLLICWNSLPKKAFDLAQSLRYLLNLYMEFSNAHQRVIVGLTQTDLQLTNLEHLCETAQNYEGVLKLESEVEAYTPLLQSVDNQGRALLDRTGHGKTAAIQSMMEEYWILWKEIERRLCDLKSTIPKNLESKVEAKRYEVDQSVQVDTLRFEKESAIQVDTLGLTSVYDSGQITSREAYLMELETAIGECTANLESLQASVQSPTPTGDDVTAASSALVKMIGLCHSSVELVKHLSSLLLRECGVTEEEARTAEVHNLCVQYDALVAIAKAREQHLRSVRLWNADSYMFICEHDRARLTCPLCSKKNWQQLDNDLWRLEKWLEFAEGTQSTLDPVPTNIEQLEDAIQDHREFLMNLDSHNNIVVSLNIVGKHLADHTEDVAKANELRSRLESTNRRWESVCQAAGRWQTRLQTSLMENHEFHQTIDELVNWLEKTENSIRQTEPVDLTEDLAVIEEKYNKFRELLADLEKCEPRVLSLQEAADHLLKQGPSRGSTDTPPEGAGASGHTAWERLTNLRLRLQSLRRICRVYVLKLGSVLGRDPSELGIAVVGTLGAQSLSRLSQELLDQTPGRTHLQGTIPPEQQHSNGPGGEDDEDRTVLSRSYRFLGRVLRASLPIQAALMLLLVGVASLVPNAEEDYSCALANNFARSFEPMLTYPDGPPPV
ncbi:muscle-specific protein 300 kDa-like [Hetaerina americana]|uniref:muscle-specific protein 300 kDa-like n=1 Tax=Hetaerina americana TaxID=62018 RepID=UPI003A7F22EC